MTKWTESDILALPVAESPTFDRKGARLFDYSSEKAVANLVKVLAKEVSAFANSVGAPLFVALATTALFRMVVFHELQREERPSKIGWKMFSRRRLTTR